MRYAIKNDNSGYYFEQDFAGWSWQDNIDKACKFKDREKAEEYKAWLIVSGFPCSIVEST
jgi:hypothetical protein